MASAGPQHDAPASTSFGEHNMDPYDSEDVEVERQKPYDFFDNDGEVVEVELLEIADGLNNNGLNALMNLQVEKSSPWLRIAQEHWFAGRVGMATDTVRAAVGMFQPRQNYEGLCQCYTFQGHLALHQARISPRVILANAREDRLDTSTVKPSAHYLQEAFSAFKQADEAVVYLRKEKRRDVSGDDKRIPLLVGKVMLALANKNIASAESLLKQFLKLKPNNLVGLMYMARIHLLGKRPVEALQIYQRVLQLSPKYSPDPRVGIGLAYYLAGDHEKAQVAWKRAVELNADCTSAQYFLTLIKLNETRVPLKDVQREVERGEKRIAAYAEMASIFRQTQGKQAAVDLALIENFENTHAPDRAVKLAERAIQYADTMMHTRKALAERCRLAYVTGRLEDVDTYAKMLPPGTSDPAIDVIAVQAKVQADDIRGALNAIDRVSDKLGANAPLEIRMAHALLLAHPTAGIPDAELAIQRRKARDTLDRIHDFYKKAKGSDDAPAQLRAVLEDYLTFVQLAKLWQEENIEKAIDAYKTAIEVYTLSRSGEDTDGVDLTAEKMTTNLGVLYLIGGNAEAAIGTISDIYGRLQQMEESEEVEQLRTTVLFNLGRCFDAQDNHTESTVAYEELLKRHPEFVQAKLSLAELYLRAGRRNEAEIKLKEAQLTNPNDMVVRSAVSSLLLTQERWDVAYQYAGDTRRINGNDVYALCVLGSIHYRRARESKADDTERSKEYCKSAEAFSQALVVDSACTIAAQGLAVAIAEDVIPYRKGGREPTTESRLKSLDTALGIFNRIKDSRSTPAILINVGHCLMNKGDEERAVESYSAASAALEGLDAQVLLYLARAHQAMGTKKQNFDAMKKALAACQRAMNIKPDDKTLLYNVALIQQKAADLVDALSPSERTVQDIDLVERYATQSIALFGALADVREPGQPYDVDLADQRAKYGTGLLKRLQTARGVQAEFEHGESEKHMAARRVRDEHRARLQAIEREAEEQKRKLASEEEAQREQQREEARVWRDTLREKEHEEETRRLERIEHNKTRKSRKDREGSFSGDEGKPRRSRKKKASKEASAEPEMDIVDDDEEERAVMSDGSGDEGGEPGSRSRSRSRSKPAPKLRKKRPAAIDPDEGEDSVAAAEAARAAKKGKFKSAEKVEDSDTD